MKTNKPLLVVGPVRNCVKTIREDVYRIKDALSDYELRWYLVESDSNDGSVLELDKMKVEIPGFDYISLGSLESQYPSRTDRLAVVRNRYIEQVEKEDVDYVVVADLDNINSLLDKDAIRSCDERDDWDVVCANQDGPYYDVWALRADNWLSHDCWVVADALRAKGVPLKVAMELEVYPHMRTIPKDSEWIEVESAFGGFAIYKKEALMVGKYIGSYTSGRHMCEHVPMNKAIRQAGYKIFINPRLINCGVNEHTVGVK